MSSRESLGGTDPTRSWAFGLLLVAGWLGAGCLGTSPDPRFYTLNALATPEAAPVDAESLGIGVGPIHLPRYLQRPQIVTRRGDHRLEYHELRRWGGSLESEALRVVGVNLSVLLATDRVAVYPLQGGFPLKYRVRMDVEKFDGEPNGEMRLQVRWVIGPGAGGDALAVGYSNLREVVDSARFEALIQTHSELLLTLSQEIAKRIRELEEQEGPEGSGEPAPVD